VATVEMPSGPPITFDGKVETVEWKGALERTSKLAKGKSLRFVMKRTGAWLAVGMTATRAYKGEMMRICIASEDGTSVVSLFAGIGQPALPPALFRRGPPVAMLDSRVEPESPRGVRLRTLLRGSDSWSAEYLIRLSTFGIGCGDLRTFRFFLMVMAPPVRGLARYVEIPANVRDHADVFRFAMLKSNDNWGAGESWEPMTQAMSRAFDDHALLHRLSIEHESFDRGLAPDELVISNTIVPRSERKINALRAQLDAGRRRNPTLTAWDYFLGRLLHEANFRKEARKLIEALPPPLARLAPFVHLAAEHHIDTHAPAVALKLLEGRTDIPKLSELVATATLVKAALEAEAKAIEADSKKAEKNPRVLFILKGKGTFECELFEDDAPCAVRNFMDLVLKQRFYDGLVFKPVIGGTAAETGDPRSRVGATVKQDNPGWRLKFDKSKREFLRGYLALVPEKGGLLHGSKILFSVSPLVRATKVVFGRVVAGLEVVDRIEQGDRIERVEVIYKRNHAYDALGCRVR
jgi:peptidyl-prolyl cis-trans isomerase B (cyclophilin B)